MMKKRNADLLIFLFFIFTVLFVNKKTLLMCDNKNEMILKQEKVIKTYERWIDTIQNRKSIIDYLNMNQYKKIAIYGLGRIGKQLYQEIMMSSIDVAFIVDMNFSKELSFYKKTPCYHPDSQLPIADLMIITVPSEEKRILDNMKDKMSCPIKSMNDILFVI